MYVDLPKQTAEEHPLHICTGLGPRVLIKGARMPSSCAALVALAATACAAEASLVQQPQSINVPLSCNPSCTAPINAAISACNDSCTVTLDAGTYILDGPAYAALLHINGKNGFALQGAGASPSGTVLMCTDIASVFSISGGTNVTLTGFAIDMQRVPFTYGHVTAVQGGSSTVTFDSTQLYPIDLGRYPWLGKAQSILGYDPVLRRVAVNATDIYVLDNPFNVTYLSTTGTGAQMVIPTALDLNGWVIVRHQVYSYNAISASFTSGFSVLNVSMWAVGGMGVLTNGCNDINIIGMRIERVNGRPMSITADGMHFSNTRGGSVNVIGGLYEGQGDDGLNIPTIFQAIDWLSADRMSFTVNNQPGTPTATQPVVHAGSTVNFFNRSSLALLATGSVVSVSAHGNITLAAPLPAGLGLYSLINDAGSYASTFTLTDNIFRANRARGALIKTSNVYAARNVFVDISGPAIKTETDGCYWFEGHPVSNWTVADNAFINNNFGPAKMLGDITIDNAVPVFSAGGVPTAQCVPFQGDPPVQTGIIIANNSFTQSYGTNVVAVYSANGAVLEGNTVMRTAGAPSPQFDFVGFGVQAPNLAGNTCDGRACTSSGL